MDGCSRQNPAYRSATGKGPRRRGPFLLDARRYPGLTPHARKLAGLRYATHRPCRTAFARGSPLAAVAPRCEHVFVLIVCVLIPRFELAVAAGGREALAAGPVALAPEPGREQLIGEASAAAEAYGVRAGLRLGEALARCPHAAAGGARSRRAWPTSGTRLLAALEGIGAAVESGRARARLVRRAGGLRNLHGGSLEGVIAAARGARCGTPARLGAAPSRFAALAAASRARARRPEIAPEAAAALAAYLAPLPVVLLARAAGDRGAAGDARALRHPHARRARRAAARRAGRPLRRRRPAGARPRARAATRRCVPRRAAEQLEERLELPESASGHAARARARPADRPAARPPRAARPHAARRRARRQAGRGRDLARARDLPRGAGRPAAHAARARARGWPSCPRRPTRCACAPRASARRRATSARCWPSPPPSARARLREAVRQARAAAGPDAALRILPVDPDSRVPERRLALAPWDP